jgi:ferredoxin-type protein NapH
MLRYNRLIIRLLAFSFMFVIPLLNLYEIYSITGTFYAINIGGLGIADPSAILQSVFSTGTITIPLLTAALFPVLLCLLLGRVWCGWLCPFHLLSDGIHKFRNYFTKNRRIFLHSPLRANLTRFGFLLMGTAVAGALSLPILNYFNAPGIISTEAMILVKERWFSIEIVLIITILILELTFLPRFWCRLFCPTGAVLSLFRAPFGLRVETDMKNPKKPCCSEHYCEHTCPMGLDPYKESNDLLCTNCGKCIQACASGRLRFRGFSTK